MGLVSRIGIGAALCAALATAQAALVTSQFQSLGGNQWHVDFTIVNDGGSAAIEGLTVYFEPNLFAQLSNAQAPIGWTPLVWQPEGAPLWSDGAFDALADDAVHAVQPGTSLSGFGVDFVWLGTSTTPGELSFEFYRLIDGEFASEGGGTTQQVPLPATGWLSLAGLSLLAAGTRRGRVAAEVTA